MNGKINLDLKAIKFIFDRNKFYIPPIAVIFICIILFFQFVIPQFNMIFTAKEEAQAASLKLGVLKQNLNVLMNTNENSLDSQLEILNLALPLDKNFDGIINSINSSANKAGADLGSFSFQVGDLSIAEEIDKFPSIKLSVPVNSDVFTVKNFLEAINRTLPLSDVSSIRIGNKTSMIDVRFYYKPLIFSGNIEKTAIAPFSQKGLSLITELEGFKSISPSAFQSIPVATSSSETDSNPF